MAKRETLAVQQFKAPVRATRGGIETLRRNFDTPVLLENMVLDQSGSLYMPPAPKPWVHLPDPAIWTRYNDTWAKRCWVHSLTTAQLPGQNVPVVLAQLRRCFSPSGDQLGEGDHWRPNVSNVHDGYVAEGTGAPMYAIAPDGTSQMLGCLWGPPRATSMGSTWGAFDPYALTDEPFAITALNDRLYVSGSAHTLKLEPQPVTRPGMVLPLGVTDMTPTAFYNTVDDIPQAKRSDTVPPGSAKTGFPFPYHGSVGAMYRSRRWLARNAYRNVMSRGHAQTPGVLYRLDGQRLWYSEINQPETFVTPVSAVTNWIDLTVAQTGPRAAASDEINLLQELGDQLVIGTALGMWSLSGASAADFTLRRSSSDVGALAPQSIGMWDGGFFFLGGMVGQEGIYYFNGSTAKLVSESLADVFVQWRNTSDFLGNARNRTTACMWNGHYILANNSMPTGGMLVYNPTLQSWSVFTGWGTTETDEGHAMPCAVTAMHDSSSTEALVISDGHQIYRSDKQLARHPRAVGRVTLGFEGESGMGGRNRYFGLRLFVWVGGASGAVALRSLARTPDGVTIDSPWQEIDAANTYHNVWIDLGSLRSPAIQITVEIRPSHADQEVLIEGAELELSRREGTMSGRQ